MNAQGKSERKKSVGNRKFQCETCGKVFQYNYMLSSHQRYHTKEKPLKCPYCEKYFAMAQGLSKHLKSCHVSLKPYRCKICSAAFHRASLLLRHRNKVHSNEKHYICDVCQFGFRFQSQLSRHALKHSMDVAFKCELCQRSFTYKSSMLRHMKKCKDGAATGEVALDIKSCVHETTQRSFKCKSCPKFFPSATKLEHHQRSEACEGEYRFSCELCGRYFRRLWTLKIHYKVHTDQRDFKCEYCHRGFQRSYDLTVHIRTHTGERNFHCKECSKAFVTASHLSKHKKMHAEKKI